MRKILIAAAALNQIPLDFEGNTERIYLAIDTTESSTAILCLPELCITGYGCEDAFFYPEVIGKAGKCLATIGAYLASKRKQMLLAVGTPILIDGAIYDSCVLVWIENGKPQYLAIPKQNLCADGVHYEPRWFKEWPAGQTYGAWSAYRGVGDFILDWNDINIGIEICEDAWVANRPGISLARRGANIILNPSASHFAFNKSQIRERFVVEGSRAFNCAYVLSNLLGNESGRLIYDGDTIIASGGKLIASGPRLSFRNVVVTSAVIDIDENKTKQIQNHSFKQSINTNYAIINVNTGLPEPKFPIGWTECTSQELPEDHLYHDYSDDLDKAKQFSRAVSLGLFDYMRKSGSHGFALSLSGGADSAAVAILVKMMIEYGIAELGFKSFVHKIGIPYEVITAFESDEKVGIISLLREIMTCVYQRTENSTPETELAAKTLAERLGFKFVVWDVEDIVASYEDKVEAAIGRPLFWDTDDLALQNIQARVRSPGIWMLANIKNALLLSTSNRSEAAVGYATMDGDTSGGLAPIAGIDKAYLLKWLNSLALFSWLEPKDHPIQMILGMKPTAELRPKEMEQSDEKDLMPYEVLDMIEKAAIRDKLGPESAKIKVNDQIMLMGLSDTWKPDQVNSWVDKFFRLFTKNQWKRERIAPAFFLDDENLDPKTWCRFPILSKALK
jgi:NAD+ synthase (glutamine-hydrolysing)